MIVNTTEQYGGVSSLAVTQGLMGHVGMEDGVETSLGPRVHARTVPNEELGLVDVMQGVVIQEEVSMMS